MLRQHSGGSSVISLGCAMARAANLRVAFDSGCQPHGADLASGKDELRDPPTAGCSQGGASASFNPVALSETGVTSAALQMMVALP